MTGKVTTLIIDGCCNAQAFLVSQAEKTAPDDCVLVMRRVDDGRSVIAYANMTPEIALMLATLAADEAIRWERGDG